MLDNLRALFKGYEDKVYLVGGTVRDTLLDKTPKDIDLLVKIEPEVLLNLGFKYIDPRTSIPIFTLSHEKLGRIEASLPRTERKIGDSHTDFEFKFDINLPIEDDLYRRDFTINSIAQDLTGKFIDPFDGISDLKMELLDVTNEIAFKEDPLRVYRALRFICKGFIPTPYLETLIQTIPTYTIPVERIYNEMMLAMKEDNAEQFFVHLVKLGIGQATFRFVHLMPYVPAGPEKYHGTDSVFTHSIDTMKRVMAVSDCPYTRFAAFFHDIGKILTPEEEWPHHYEHDYKGYAYCKKWLNKIKAEDKLKKIVEGVVSQHMRIDRIYEMKLRKKLELVNTAKQKGYLEALKIVHIADGNLSTEEAIKINLYIDTIESVIKLNIEQLGLTMEDFKDKSGEKIGEIVLSRRVYILKNLLDEK
jgi:tRNA nucleotidyltransferase (CCA-adding enzyme)